MNKIDIDICPIRVCDQVKNVKQLLIPEKQTNKKQNKRQTRQTAIQERKCNHVTLCGTAKNNLHIVTIIYTLKLI